MHIYNSDFGYRTFIFVSSPVQQSEPLLNKKPKRIFKDMLLASGCSGKVVVELWKWYDKRISYLDIQPVEYRETVEAAYALIPEQEKQVSL